MRRHRSGSPRRPASRIGALAAVLALALLGAAVPAVPASAVVPVSDNEPPISPTAFASPTVLDASGGTVAVSVRARDDVSGIASGFEVWYEQGGVQTAHAMTSLTEGTATEGLWTASVPFDAGATGTWRLHVGAMTDLAGNVRPTSGLDWDGYVRVGYPSPPTEVVATATGTGHVLRLAWPPAADGGVPISGYRVVDSYYAELATTGADDRTFDMDLDAPGYFGNGTFRVVSVNPTGESLASIPSPKTPAPFVVPQAPVIAPVSSGRRSAWVDVQRPDDALMQAITRVTVTAEPGGATCVVVDGDGCALSGLEEDTEYSITAIAENAAGLGPRSSARTVVPWGPPARVTGVTAVADDVAHAVVTWDHVVPRPQDPFVYYTVRTEPASDTCTVYSELCGLSGLKPGTTYQVLVTAHGLNGGAGAESAPVPVNAYGRPGFPARFHVACEVGRVRATWEAARPNGRPITGYAVRARSGGGGWRTVSLGASARSGTITGLAPGDAYVQIEALNAAGASGFAGSFCIVPDPRIKPSRPDKPVVQASTAHSFSTRWNPVEAGAGTQTDRYEVVVLRHGHVVDRRAVAGTGWRLTVTGLQRATAYQVSVRAHNRAGWGPGSRAVSAHTKR